MKNSLKSVYIILSIIFYFLAFYFGRSYFGSMMGGVFLIFPVIVFAWFYGSIPTAIFSVVLSIFHFLIVYFIFQEKSAFIYNQSLIGTLAVTLTGLVVGHSRDSAKKITELQQHAIALKLGIERAREIVFITDAEGVIIYANPAFEKTYGFGEKDWTGNTPRILKSGLTSDSVYKELWTKLKSKESIDYQIVNKTKDGRLIDIESSASPVLDERDNLIGFLAIQKDITLLKQTESKLKAKTSDLENVKNELEQRQKALLNVLEDQKVLQEELKKERDTVNLIVGSMGEGLLMIGKEFKIQLINLKAQSILGVDEKDVIGKVWADVVRAYIGETEIPFEKRTSVQVLKTGASLVTELDDNHYYLTPLGKKFPVTSVTTPIISKEEVTGVVKVFRDASIEKESKRVIEETVKERTSELHEEQQISSAILENAGEGVVLSDSKGKIRYVNPAFVKMTGLSEKEIRGREFSEIFKAYDVKDKPIKPEEISDAAAVTAVNHEMKIQMETPNRDKLAVLINASPVNVEEKYIGIVRVMHNITEDLKLQQQKDDFFSIASHELRTPLTVISGNLDTLLTYSESALKDSDKSIIQDTVESSDRLIKLISDYLNVSRLDQRRLKYTIEKLSVCELTDNVVKEMKQLTDKKGLSLSFDCKGNSHPVLADEGLFKEIMINLIGNAIKFTEEGGIKITHAIDGEFLKISIVDSGVGIPKSMQSLLFQRFQQAQSRTLTRMAGGTGLGLYISREFCKILGGDLFLESSEPGKGSTFSFRLPLASHESKAN